MHFDGVSPAASAGAVLIVLTGALLVAIILVVPAVVAIRRGVADDKEIVAILVISVLAGWTIAGWAILLLLALRPRPG